MIYAYIRCSTDRQANEGESIETQKSIIAGYAAMNQWIVDEYVIDGGVSGSISLNDRPSGYKLMAKIAPGDTVIAAKLDRLFRSAYDALGTVEIFKEKNIGLHLIDMGGDVIGDGVSKVFFTLVAAFAEFERERIAERIRETKHKQKTDGAYLGGHTPFGYSVSSNRSSLIDKQDEQDAIRDMIQMRERGLPLWTISDEVKKTHGFNISAKVIRAILLREGRAYA